MQELEIANLHESVQNYYGEVLTESCDLQTNACCTAVAPPEHIKNAITAIHEEVNAKYYGCGITIPEVLEGTSILDLGSGSGRDCYIAAQLAGPGSRVVGVDMTPAQLNVANKYILYHEEKFGYPSGTVSFLEGNIEKLDELPFQEAEFDIIMSNCVINLAMDKQKVLKDVYRLLKPGGEMYFSDVYCNRRIPISLQKDELLWGECLSGALYWNDFLKYATNAGFADPRVVETKPITVNNKELETKLNGYQFFSVTYRLFKIEELESDCEDYGQAVMYKGDVATSPIALTLDEHHIFPAGKVMTVCGNTYRMLQETRFQQYFDFYGTWDQHFGIFEGCGGKMPFNNTTTNNDPGSCC